MEEGAITSQELQSFELGVPGPLRDELVMLVLAGAKRATSSLLDQWRASGHTLPRPGERYAMVDSDGVPVAVVQVTEVDVIRLDEADLALALDEGEGFETVEAWREAHERFWREEVLPELGGGGAQQLFDDTRIVVQRFTVVSRRPPAGTP